MANLAIKGHATRGEEVITLLKMLGGKNNNHCCGGFINRIYFINENGYIESCDMMHHLDYIQLTLEEFFEKFPYKVGDKVITDDGDKANIVGMVWDNDIDDVFYETQICNEVFKYPKELLQPFEEKESMETAKITITPQYHWNKDKIEIEVTKDYEIKEENGKYYVVKKQPKYPKTYAECFSILDCKAEDFFTDFSYKGCDIEISDYEDKIDDLLQNFRKLRYCRDAYWKIAGEQMGLGKPWEPDFDNENEYKYGLFRLRNIIYKDTTCINPTLLIFSTKEMRDAFYENFKDLIEQCKELL